MARSTLLFTLLFSALVAYSMAQGQNNYQGVIQKLSSFQDAGGFLRSSNAEAPSLRATSSALMISSLYGLDVDSTSVTGFIRRLSNGDAGYGQSYGMVSDITAVRDALSSFRNLRMALPNPLKIVSFVRGLYDPSTSLFRTQNGGSTSLEATAIAFEIFELLGELESKFVEGIKPAILKVLEEADKSNYFSTGSADMNENYFCVFLSSRVGYSLGNTEDRINYLINAQGQDGSWATDFLTTVNAVRTLDILGGASRIRYLQSLVALYRGVPEDIIFVSLAHTLAVLTGTHTQDFNLGFQFEGVRGAVVIQGTPVKPYITAPRDLEVSVSIKSRGEEVYAVDMEFDATRGFYRTNEVFDTSLNLGELDVQVKARKQVVGIGEVSLDFADQKSIGYGVSVEPSAEMGVTGKSVPPGSKVNLGTQFSFDYTFSTQQEEDLKQGDFDVTFLVLDSSLVEIHRAEIDARENTQDISFAYTLEKNDTPSGALVFRVQLSNDFGVHTVHDTIYYVTMQMVASEIQFIDKDEPIFQIGDTVTVNMVPGSYPDLRNVYPYSEMGTRRFVMDITSPEGALIQSVPASSATGRSVRFEANIPASLSSLGANIISFRYIPAVGDPVALGNFNNQEDELYEDALSIQVNAELQMSSVSQRPDSFDFYYGNVVRFSFELKDLLSEKFISGGDASTVYLELEHSQNGKKIISTSQAATVYNGVFTIEWAVTPNDISGDSKLRLVAKDADGNSLALLDENGEVAEFDAKIGGDIEVSSNSFSTTDPTLKETAFLTQFQLSCRDEILKGASLSAKIVKGSTALFTIPVVSLGEGNYQVSWTLPHAEASAGNYAIDFYRNVDLQRADEQRQLLLAKKQTEDFKAAAEADKNGKVFVPKPFDDSQVAAVEPLFNLALSHEGSVPSSLPVRTEFLVLCIFGAAFVALFYQRYFKYTPQTK